jgi:hypothetical protein
MGWRLCWTVREDSDGNYTDVTNTGGIIDRQDLSPTLQTDGHTHTSVAAISWRAYSPSFKKKKKEKNCRFQNGRLTWLQLFTFCYLLLYIP